MTLACEHNSISRVLATFDAPSGVATPDALTRDSFPLVFISWSSRQALLLRPEYAWLQSDNVSFVRLPQVLQNLVVLLEQASLRNEPDPYLETLLTKLGQWDWALKELRNALGREERKTLYARIRNLQEFALRNWPGLYQSLLIDVQENLNDEERARKSIDTLILVANRGAVLVACLPVLGWVERTRAFETVMTLGDALCYLTQGKLGIEQVNKVASQCHLSQMQDDLNIMEEGIKLIRRVGCSEKDRMSERVEVTRHCLDEIRKCNTFSASTTSEEVQNAYHAVEKVTATIEDILKLRDDIVAAVGV